MSDYSEEARLSAENERGELDRGQAVRGASQELAKTVALKLGDLADEILDRPQPGTDAWLEERATRNTAAGRQRTQEWHLVKMEIQREAGLNQTGDVMNARAAGATWEAIGQACGMTAKDAEGRWGPDQDAAYPYTSVGMEGEDLG